MSEEICVYVGCGSCSQESETPKDSFEVMIDASIDLSTSNVRIKDLEEHLSEIMTELNHERHRNVEAHKAFREAYKAFHATLSDAFLS